MKKRFSLIAILFSVFVFTSSAWIYPEHRDITLLAIRKLDPERRQLLDKLWAQARIGYEYRLSEAVADTSLGVNPKYLDYAAWSAIGGDHSVSPENMVHNILKTDWILKVADVAARLKNGIAAAKNESDIEGELRNSDLRFLRVDPEYISRAGANYGHFLLARPEVSISASDYFYSCYKEGADLNLIGLYTNFHTSALLKASRLASENLTPEQSSELALAALADEAFALHFLEDGFSAGHVAGIWGNASVRKGTHDYYDEHGLDVVTWNGNRLVLMGDAYMQPGDTENASDVVLLSLKQLLDAAMGKNKSAVFDLRDEMVTADTFNTSKAFTMPVNAAVPDYLNLYYEILINTPVPGLARGSGEIPRFRSEIGPFIGIAPSASVSEVFGGYEKSQTKNGAIPSLEFAIHFGVGTDGVLNKSGDGLVFLDLGWRLDGASTIKIKPGQAYNEFGSIFSAIPSREALFARIRLPFYVIPGDLLVAAPVLLLLSPDTFNKMVTTASQGGLIPWQSGIITPLGRFQFMLGREVGVSFYGVVKGADSFLVPDERWGEDEISLISMRTTKLTFPFLEYRPIRTFSRKQSASLLVQLYSEVDIPGKVTMKLPVNVDPVELNSVWSLGVKLGFDWRYYYANK